MNCQHMCTMDELFTIQSSCHILSFVNQKSTVFSFLLYLHILIICSYMHNENSHDILTVISAHERLYQNYGFIRLRIWYFVYLLTYLYSGHLKGNPLLQSIWSDFNWQIFHFNRWIYWNIWILALFGNLTICGTHSKSELHTRFHIFILKLPVSNSLRTEYMWNL